MHDRIRSYLSRHFVASLDDTLRDRVIWLIEAGQPWAEFQEIQAEGSPLAVGQFESERLTRQETLNPSAHDE